MNTPPSDAPSSGAHHLADGVDRRTVLRRALQLGATGVLGGGLPGLLAACGKTTPPPAKRSDYAFVYGTATSTVTAPPLGDLATAIATRARQLNVTVRMSGDDSQDRVQLLGLDTAIRNQRDPQTGEFPLTYSVVVSGVAVSAEVDSIVAAAIARGAKVVSYLEPIAQQTAAITVDAAKMGTLLATHAAQWATQHLGGRGTVLLLEPTPGDVGPRRAIPFASLAPDGMRTLRAELARLAPGLEITTTQHDPEGVTGLAAAQMVLCWRDDYAARVAQKLRAVGTGGREKLYVGGLGLPAVSSRDTLVELRRDDVLRAVAAAPLRDLATALVDLPTTLLLNLPAQDVHIAPVLLTPGSRALADEERDYSSDPAAALGSLASRVTGSNLQINEPRNPASRPAMRAPASTPAR